MAAEDYSGMPAGVVDPKTGQLLNQYKITPQTNANQASNQAGFQSAWAGLKPDTSGLDLYRKQATAAGPSTWANLATQQQQQGEQTQRNQAVQQGAGNAAAARSNLAMQGGLNSGARERLAMSGANNQNQAQQQIGAQGAQARTGISMQDEQNKTSMLANLPGMENTALQPGIQKANAWQGLAQNEAQMNQQNQQFNVANDLNAQSRNTGTQLENYNNQMKDWAAGKQADATANSGKK